jgi:hypothetical protein
MEARFDFCSPTEISLLDFYCALACFFREMSYLKTVVI